MSPPTFPQLLAPTGFCGPSEIGPVCYADPLVVNSPSSIYSGDSVTIPWSDFSTRGLLPYFREGRMDSAPPTPPPLDQNLPLSEYRDRLPAELQPYLAPLVQIEAEFGVPVSFRVVNLRLSTGEEVPQIYFFRTGEEGETPWMRSPRGGGGAGPAPEPTTFGLTVNLFGGAAAVVAYDHLLIRPLIDNGLVPPEMHSPLLFTSLMTGHLALHRAGLVKAAPGQAVRGMPTFMGFQMLAGLLMEGLGVEPGPARDLGTLTLSMMPLLLARQSPVLAEALEAAAAGRGFQLAGLSGEAATLRVGAAFARILGWIGLIDLGARLGTWGIGNIVSAVSSGDTRHNMRIWNLIRMSQDIINQEDCGSFAASVFGSFLTFGDTVHSWIDDDYDAYYQDRVRRTYLGLAEGSDEFGESLHSSLAAIIGRHISVTPGGTDGTYAVDSVNWDGIAADVAAFYQEEDNADNIRAGYGLVDDATAPMTASGISELIDIVSVNGEIPDRDQFRVHFRNYAGLQLFRKLQTLESRALELGLAEDVDGVRVFRMPSDPSRLTAAQNEFLTGEGLRLSTEIAYLTLLEEAMER
ncbi:MAG TPA: hypothetical protein VLJ37_09685 [bacterium]|nr:hypothetical protein [bacterium]